jgi:hypothetical protein
MKKTQMLPLAAMISGLLVGCGGGGGGGGGSSPTPTTYKFQFIHMLVDVSPSSINGTACPSPTYFKEYDSGNVDYAQVASQVHAIDSYNADGSFNQSLIDKLSHNGVLSFTENDIEDGGYISVVDNIGTSSSPIFHTLSIQKELLGDFVINLESPQGNNSTCYDEEKMSVESTARAVNLASEGNLGTPDQSGFDSYLNGQKLSAFTSTIKRPIDLVSLSDEVLATAYETGYIKGFALIKGNELSLESVNPPVTKVLEPLFESNKLETRVSPVVGVTLANSQIYARTVNDVYVWQSLKISSNDEVLLTDIFEYNIKTSGTYNGWKVESNSVLDEQNSTSLTLTDSVIYSGITPVISDCNTGCLVSNGGLNNTTKNRIQRAYIEVSSSAKHTIYGVPSDNDELVIPEYDLGASYVPQNNDSLEVSYLNSEEQSNSFNEIFMNRYHQPYIGGPYVDKVSIVIPPLKKRSTAVSEASFNYELISQ